MFTPFTKMFTPFTKQEQPITLTADQWEKNKPSHYWYKFNVQMLEKVYAIAPCGEVLITNPQTTELMNFFYSLVGPKEYSEHTDRPLGIIGTILYTFYIKDVKEAKLFMDIVGPFITCYQKAQ